MFLTASLEIVTIFKKFFLARELSVIDPSLSEYKFKEYLKSTSDFKTEIMSVFSPMTQIGKSAIPPLQNLVKDVNVWEFPRLINLFF